MTIRSVFVCDWCQVEKELSSEERTDGGFSAYYEGDDVCPDCLAAVKGAAAEAKAGRVKIGEERAATRSQLYSRADHARAEAKVRDVAKGQARR